MLLSARIRCLVGRSGEAMAAGSELEPEREHRSRAVL